MRLFSRRIWGLVYLGVSGQLSDVRCAVSCRCVKWSDGDAHMVRAGQKGKKGGVEEALRAEEGGI